MPPVTTSTPRLSEVARHLVIPQGIVTSVWPRVERRLATAGVRFDPWQQGFSSAALGCRADGKYAASIGGVVESIPRQVGKTFKDGNLVIGLAAEFPGFRAAWTSHHNRTTTNTFRKMQGLVTRKRMLPLIAPNGIRVANGEQEIRFANGSIIMFGAREQGFGRGLDEMDVLVFDEAQILSLKALEDMVPATNQAKNPHGGLVFFLGTPPRPTDEGEAFTSLRKAALDGTSKDRMFVELSADPDAAWDDRDQWRKMNPSYPSRTPEEAMLRMRELIPDEDAWRREAMGIWTETASSAVIDMAQWSLLADVGNERPSPVAFGVGVAHDRSWTTIGIAGVRPDGNRYVQAIESARGTGWVVDRVAALSRTWKPLGIAIEASGPAGSLLPEFEQKRVRKVVSMAGRDVAQACGLFVDAVSEGTLRHDNGRLLEISLLAAKKKTSGQAWVWAPRDDTDIAPLQAVTNALHALEKNHKPRTAGERRAVVLS